jgi:hypothetical protein
MNKPDIRPPEGNNLSEKFNQILGKRTTRNGHAKKGGTQEMNNGPRLLGRNCGIKI